MNLQECHSTKTWQVVQATIVAVYEPDLNKNEHGFMKQVVELEDDSGRFEVDASTKFADGFVKPEEQGQLHTWKIKCYNGALQGYTQKPAKMGGKQYNPPTQSQKTQYNQAAGETVKHLHPYDSPKDKSIHRQCAMKAAVEVLLARVGDKIKEDPSEGIKTDLVFWANFFVHYYRTGNANQPDASITEKTGDDPHTLGDMGEPPF